MGSKINRPFYIVVDIKKILYILYIHHAKDIIFVCTVYVFYECTVLKFLCCHVILLYNIYYFIVLYYRYYTTLKKAYFCVLS